MYILKELDQDSDPVEQEVFSELADPSELLMTPEIVSLTSQSSVRRLETIGSPQVNKKLMRSSLLLIRTKVEALTTKSSSEV